MRFEPLGDQAVVAYCDDEQAAFAFADRVRRASFAWSADVVQAYLSVAVFYDVQHIDYDSAAGELRSLDAGAAATTAGRLQRIPCCYELGPDLQRVAEHTGLTVEAVIAHHSAAAYTVYAIGFCPGFPYLGYLPEELAGVPRLPSPRLRVEAGSVGLTGRQTGIYTEVRPGGWNIIGRTPLVLVDVAEAYFPLRTGDQVRFERIDGAEYERRQGERL